MGFVLQVREAPPATSPADWLELTVHSEGRLTEVQLSSPNAQALEELVRMLSTVGEVRLELAGLAEEERWRRLQAAPQLQEKLFQPLQTAFAQAGLLEEEAKAFMEMVRRDLLALTQPDVRSIDAAVAARG
jgi:hypothetical protein